MHTRPHLTKSKLANILHLVEVVEIGVLWKTRRFVGRNIPTKFYLKRNFQSCLTSCVKGFFRQVMVRLCEYVENALNFIGHERSLGLKMLFFNL